ncbi:MAG: hypothetical protein GEU86_03125 [Actinophytocola sp.]|nr:hypothetical protein [Actinophytocola sp.]
MTRSWRLAAIGILVAGGMLAFSSPASAHDPEEDHGGGGYQGPDNLSKNMKLQSNLPPAEGTTTQSDLAFDGNLAYAGNYQGFRVVDISEPESPALVSDFRCNGAQSDVSVFGGLLFQSVDAPQNHGGCDSTSSGVTAATPGMFEGIRIFDISDPANPVHLDSVNTDCGSHTHTLVPDPDNDRVLIYVSSYPLGAAALGPNCVRQEDGGGHSKISIVNVPLDNPTGATVSEYQFDEDTQWATYLGAYTFRACHDIGVHVELKLAAAACMSEGQVWDISDPLHPELKFRYDNPAIKPENVDLFHSGSFSWDGKVVAFGDESGGGGAARCVDPDDDQGRIWFVDTETEQELASYKIPRSVDTTCTMHNYNFIPLRDGRKVLVSSAYSGGTTVVDVDKLLAGATEEEAEIGYAQPHGANAWSSYWYNGRVFANDITRGLDIFLLSDKARAGAMMLPFLNPQTQMSAIN